MLVLAPSYNPYIVRDPAVVRDALTLGRAIGNGRLPELDLLKIIHAVSGAAFRRLHSATVRAGCRNGGIGTKPHRQVTLQIGRQGVLHPHVRAIGIFRVHMHHCGVGPSGRAFLGNNRGNGLLLAFKEIDLEWPGA